MGFLRNLFDPSQREVWSHLATEIRANWVQPYVYLEVKDDEGWFGAAFPEGVDELYFPVPGVIVGVERLKLLFALFAKTLHQLCHTGSACKNDPQVML